MGFLIDRISVVSTYVVEFARYGLPETLGPQDREVVVFLDGVGGFQFVPLLGRRALREAAATMGTCWYRWQGGLPGEIWTDLMWLRRNRVMACRLARKLLAFRRRHPDTVIHLVAFSGGTGIAVFACEELRGRVGLETLVLACPAISPDYNLATALRCVRRCYALVSHRDNVLLGLGTRIFGTMDRRYTRSAGMVGFKIPLGLTQEDAAVYERLHEIRWSRSFREDGHSGGHTGWAGVRFLRKHLLPILRGEPLLPVYKTGA